jgi:hypothetical protein
MIMKKCLLLLAAVAVTIAVAPSDARAQAINVVEFSCASGNTIGVNIDIRGLGNTDLCVVSTITENLDCACVGGGGNCPTDTKKQTTPTTNTSAQQVEPKNGRVFIQPFTPANVTPTSSQCGLTCPSGQTPTLIQFEGSGNFKVCTVAPGTCTTDSCNSNTIATAGPCGSTGEIVEFAGKHNSCVQLFP